MENTTLFISLGNATDSGTENIEEHHKMQVSWTQISVMVILSLISLLGIIGNGLVIWFCIFRMKKTVNVVWFLCLAKADFICAFLITLNITQDVLGYWPFRRFMCNLIRFVMSLNMNVSVLQLTVISADRCLCVVFPVWCHNQRNPKLALLVALTFWMVSLALATPSVTYIDHTITHRCALKDSGVIMKTILSFIFFFLLPLIIIVFCYIVIVLHIRRKHIIAFSKPFKTIVAVIIAFFICWFPYHLFSFLNAFDRSKTDSKALYYGNVFARVLVIIHSCIDPIIYVFIGRDFKKKFCGSLQATFKKAFLEDKDKTEFDRQEIPIAVSRKH